MDAFRTVGSMTSEVQLTERWKSRLLKWTIYPSLYDCRGARDDAFIGKPHLQPAQKPPGA